MPPHESTTESGVPAPIISMEKATRKRTYMTRNHRTSLSMDRKILTMRDNRRMTAKERSNLRYMKKMLKPYKSSPARKSQ